MLLIDAANAYNSVTCQVYLQNICIICPLAATYVTNCYTLPPRLFIIGRTIALRLVVLMIMEIMPTSAV